MDPKIGALVIGGDHPGVAVDRCLGRRGIPVFVLEDQQSISTASKYVNKVVRVPDILDRKSHRQFHVGSGPQIRTEGLGSCFHTRDEACLRFFQGACAPGGILSRHHSGLGNRSLGLGQEQHLQAGRRNRNPLPGNLDCKKRARSCLPCIPGSRWPSNPRSRKISFTPPALRHGALEHPRSCRPSSSRPTRQFPSKRS